MPDALKITAVVCSRITVVKRFCSQMLQTERNN